MNNPHIIVSGSLIAGFTFIGPFSTLDKAHTYLHIHPQANAAFALPLSSPSFNPASSQAVSLEDVTRELMRR